MRKAVLVMSLMCGCGARGLDGGGAAGDPAATASDEAIQGGAADSGDPAVGLVWIRGGGFCTGTLIAADVVLTAGHCVEEAVDAFYTGAGQATPAVGPVPVAGMERHAVIDQMAYPNYQPQNRCPNPTYDEALLRLARPIAGVAPLPLSTRPPRAGAKCRAVGYGVHGSGSAVSVERKRAASEVVAGVEWSAIHVERGSGIVDHGDSGGPLLCGKAIAGTTSCGNGAADPAHTDAWYGRVDELAGWVEGTIAAWR